jgi:hypothetical protein
LFWGGVMPLALISAMTLAIFAGLYWWLFAVLILLIWPVHILQIAVRKLRAGLNLKLAAASGALLMIGKIPQLTGFAEYHLNRLMGRASQLIEHKGPREPENMH